LLFVVRKYTLSFYLLKQQQPVEMHSSYAVAPNQTHYFTSLGMRNSVIQNQIDIENINYENALTESEDHGKMDDPGQPDDETFTNKIVDGIDFNLVLGTIPRKFRREASENLEVNGVIDTISSKIIPRWDDKQRSEAVKEVLGDDGEGIYAKILLNIFKVNEHIECTRSHKSFIEKTFHRFKTVFPHLQEKSILAHDQSKLSFIEIVGYTDRWTWGRDSPLWEEALAHHYHHNPHHPQYCPGNRMTPEDLEESVVDMMACHWERKEEGGEDVPASRIAGFSDFYLDRYEPEDRELVSQLLKKVRESGL